jgi:hypothetical protein
MPNYYTPLPGAEIRNALVDFSGINNGLDSLRQAKQDQFRNALMQKESTRADQRMTMDQETHGQNMKTAAVNYDKLLADRSAGIAQMALSEKDPTRRAGIMERMYSMHPEYKSNLAKYGLNPEDHAGVANFVIAQARGYQDPLDKRAKEVGIQAQQSSIAMHDLQRQQLQMKIDQERSFNKMFDNIGQPQGQPPSGAAPTEGAARFAAPALAQQPTQPQAQNGLQAAYAKLSPEKQAAFKLAWQSGERDKAISMISSATDGLGPYKGAKEVADVEEGMRKEYAQLAKPYFEVRDAYTRINQSAKDPSAAGDLALIFNYMKMLDPGSVVREGEFATAQNAAGIPDRIRNLWNKALNGERLNENQRKDFVGQSRGLMTRQERQYHKIQEQFRGIAKRRQIDPQNVIIDFTAPPEDAVPPNTNATPPPAGPRPRAVNKDGHVIEFDGQAWVEAQ